MTIPDCQYGHSECTDARLGPIGRCCTQLDSALGWTHLLPVKTCVECAASGKPPTTQGTDALSRTFRRMLMHPLRAPIDDNVVKLVLKTTRESTIAKALSLGIPREEIIEALLDGIKNGVPRSRALALADQFKLFDEG